MTLLETLGVVQRDGRVYEVLSDGSLSELHVDWPEDVEKVSDGVGADNT